MNLCNNSASASALRFDLRPFFHSLLCFVLFHFFAFVRLSVCRFGILVFGVNVCVRLHTDAFIVKPTMGVIANGYCLHII